MKSTDKTAFKIIKNYITSLIKDAPKQNFVYPHLYYTEKWVLKLKPNADYALRLAALLHDIDRAFMKNRIKGKNIRYYKRYKSKHSKDVYKIAKKVLMEFNFSKKGIHKVLFLIKHHEYGIKSLKHTYHQDLDTLMNADSLAFFEEFEKYLKAWGKKATENKIEYTWARLSSQGKGIVKKRFFKRFKKLGSKFPYKA